MHRHSLDPVSLLFGIAFAALATTALIVDPVQLLEARWLWPGLLIVLGLALLLAPLGGRQPVAASNDADDDTLDDAHDSIDVSPEIRAETRADATVEDVPHDA